MHALGRQKQVNLCEFVSSRTASVSYIEKPCQEKTKTSKPKRVFVYTIAMNFLSFGGIY